ncbi:unnamed protein product [Timema podura]|uniref:MIF4G domain-containing protein n=1 Tax=Timema podura TaxID=61482 RepID=A0ABN7P4P2_TIMPD|nr:unnamed protein product [Timema podura]
MELSALPTGLRASRLVRKVDKPRPLKLPLNHNRLSNIEGKYGALGEDPRVLQGGDDPPQVVLVGDDPQVVLVGDPPCTNGGGSSLRLLKWERILLELCKWRRIFLELCKWVRIFLELCKRESILELCKWGIEEIMAMTEAVSGNIANGNHDSMLQHSIMTLCSHLKKYGPQLETVFKDQLDRAFLSFRNGSRDEHLDVASRLHLLEVIELRTRNWSSCEDTNNYYKQHIVEQELLPLTDMAALLSMSPTMLGPVASPTTPQPPLLSPGEIIKTSGKFGKPTKIPGKNYCKDEVVIRNSDSGKANALVVLSSTAKDGEIEV